MQDSLQEAHRPLEGSGGHLLDLLPHDNLQKVSGGLWVDLRTTGWSYGTISNSTEEVNENMERPSPDLHIKCLNAGEGSCRGGEK